MERTWVRRSIAGLALGIALGLVGFFGIYQNTSLADPEPLGEGHALEVAREYPALDQVTDTKLIAMAETVCPVLDQYGAESGWGAIMDNLSVYWGTDAYDGFLETKRASVAAYCPKYLDDLGW